MKNYLYKPTFQIFVFFFFTFFVINNRIYSQLTCSSDTNLVFRVEQGMCSIFLDQSNFSASFPKSSCNVIELETVILLSGDLKPFTKRKSFTPGNYRFYWSVVDGCDFTIFCGFNVEVKFPDGITNCNQVIPKVSALHTMCGNGDFESGIIQALEWEGGYGTIGSPPVIGFSSGAINLSTSHQTIVNKGVDPTVGILTVAPHPSPNNFSVRLGNIINGCGTEQISKEFLVTAGNTNLAFWYACVFENPGHSINIQPGFQVNLTLKPSNIDISSLVDLGNGSNFLIANSSDPFFHRGPGIVVYKDWSCVNIDLSRFINQIVEIEFINKDCGAGGHWGYTYLDNICVGCPSGNASLVNATCIPGNICVNYSLPMINGVSGQCRFLLDLIRDGITVYSDTSAMISSGSQFCFQVDTCELLDEDFYDYKIKIDCSVPAPLCPLVPPPIQNPIHLPVQYLGLDSFGIKPGLNNDLPTCCIFPSLSCDDHINVSLDSSCCAIITPDMIIEGNYPVKCLKVVLKDKNGIILPSSPKVTGAQIGQLITVELIDTCTKNRCWGTLTVEDKLPPRVMCQNPDTVFCNNTSYQWSPPIVRDNCTGIATVHIITDNTIKKPCDSFCIAERQIQYYYTDFYGNHSDTCIKKICYKKLDWKDIKWPSDTLFSCEFWTSPPSPTHAGIPTGGGKPLYPSWGECKLAVTYEDQVITICPKSFKVLRKWTVIDWCKTSPNNVAIHYQVIKVVDEKGPVILCSPDITISTDVWTCTGTAIIPPPKVIKECSDSVSIEVSYKISSPNGPTKIGTSLNNIKLLPNGYYSVTGLPHGLNLVSFVVTDGCGNSSECFTAVTVIDQVPPVAICDQKTVVTLTIDGTAKIEAYTFDDGSHDNCMLDRFEVKRMDNGDPCSTPNGDQWGPYVFFCCKDIGKTIMVSLQVWDKSGNSNTCMVEVVVQDKIAPVIFCPSNITVSCAFDYSDVKVFGNVVTDISLRKPIVINDPGLKANGPLQDGYAYDGCGARVNELAPRFNLKCGSGTITRYFEAIDSVGLRSYCTQTITIQDIDPANVTVQWPRDFTSNTVCANVPDLNPNVTGVPRVIGADACNQIVTTHTDQLFELEPDACIKILRKWIILDWCIYDPNASNPRGYWTWVQTIKVTNTVGPVFTSSCADRTIETFGPGCGGRIELRGLAKDDCTDSSRLVWYHSVDINNDGLSPGIEYLFSGPGNDASNIYPLGKHKITYLVKDACGNESKCSFIITVVDKKKPTPYCVTSITTTVMPNSKEIEIWAKDFNLNSEDNCTPKDRLQYFFKVNNTYQTSMKLTCANIGQNTIKVYVVDEYGNEDYCEVTLVLQDPNKVCGTTNLASDGHIRSTTGILMPEVSVKLVEAGQIINESKTNNQGVYAFQNLIKNHSYTIKPTHNENPSNGVSTQDILMIQKHILGVKQFDTPFQYIAADVNKTSTITAADISEIRKLILGVIPQFSKNDSWRFVSKSHVFKDLHSVFPFEEKIEIESINEDKNNLDFIGVKIGDVNASASIIGETNLATRQKEKHKLSYQFLQDRTIAIIAGQELNMTGIQLGIELNSCQIESISSAALEIEEEHYLIDDGRLKIAYTTDRAKIVQKGDILFYFRLKEDRKNVSLYSIRQEEFKSEFYDQELKAHVLILDDEENKNTFLISSVEKDGQQIKLKIHSENLQEVSLRIYNIQGILLAQSKRNLADGSQEIQIPCADFNTGVFLIQCENTNQSQIIKLIN